MAEAIRQFIPDPETGTLKLIFTDAGSGLEVPLSDLINYDVLSENGLGELVPVTDVSATPTTDPISSSSPNTSNLVLPQKGTGTEHGPYGDGQGRTQGNNFGYLSKPGFVSAAANLGGPLGQVAGALGATGLMGPLGAVSTAGKLASGLINNNNALAASSARQSLGLNPSSAAKIAKETYSDNKGRVADINANGNTYSVGLEATTEDGRTTLTPEEGRRRGLTSGVAVVEATPEQSKANVKGFKAEGFPSQRGLLGKIADQVLNKEVSAPLAATTTPTVSTPARATATALGGPTSAVTRSNLPNLSESPKPSQQASVASQMGVNTTGTGLLGVPTPNTSKPMPSFAELSATPSAASTTSIPSVPASKLGSFNNTLNQETVNEPGLAGISKSFKAGTYGTIGSFDRTGLTSGISKAVDAVGKALGPDVGINSSYRDPNKNAKVGGAKQSQHLQGNAVDINTTGWTDDQKAAALDAAATSGAKGIGVYSSGNSLHIDARDNFATWGASPKGAYKGVSISDQPSWSQDTLQAIQDAGPGLNPGPRFGPTPTPRDTALATPSPATPEAIATSQVGIGVAPANVTNSGLASMVNNDVGKLSVGALSNQGFAPNYTDQEVNTMAVGLAGELGPRTLQGIARQDPQAMAELSSVVSTMQNRIAEKGIGAITDPSQFNAFSTSALPNGNVPANVTRANFEKFGGSLIEGVKQAVSGVVQSPTPDATHYANRDIGYAANKSYNKDMTGVAKVGAHTFGTVPGEFDQKKSAAAQEQEARAKQAVANFSDYSGVARQEQKLDRKATNVTGLASTGLGSVNGQKKTPEAKTESQVSKTKETSKSDSNVGPSTRGSGGNTTTGSGGMSGVSSRGSDGGVTGKGTSAPSGDGGGGKGKGVGSKSSSKSDSKSGRSSGSAGPGGR